MIAYCLASTDHGPLLVNRMDGRYNSKGDYFGVGAYLLEDDCYEPRDVATFKDLLLCRRNYFGDGLCVLDGGANIGAHTVEFSRILRGCGSVIAVEAQERIFYALCGNITLQNCLNVRAIWAALAEAPGTIDIPEPDYTRPSSFGSFELKPRVGTEYIGQPIDYGKPTSRVRTLNIDSLELPRLDLLKLDVEGMEQEALIGAQHTIATLKPILFIETVKSDKAAITEALELQGYKCLPNGMNLLAVHKDDPTVEHVSVVREQV